MPPLQYVCHVISKVPFKTMFSRFNTACVVGPVKAAYFGHSLPVNDKLLSFLENWSENLLWVMSIHAQIVANSLCQDQFLATVLVRTYSSLGCLLVARKVFDRVYRPKTILCNAMIGGYLRNEQWENVIELFRFMDACDVDFDTYTCNFVLKACIGLEDYDTGMEVVRIALERGMERDRFLGSSLINFLVKFGEVDEAERVFCRMRGRDVVSWNSMIGGYVEAGDYKKVFNLFCDMRNHGIMPTSVTMIGMIQACGGGGYMKLGRCVHGFVLELGMGDDVSLLTSLIDMYGKMEDIRSAQRIFHSIAAKNVVSWNAIISCCIQIGYIGEAFDLFRQLVISGVNFDSGTVVSILQVCTQTADAESGKVLHACVFRRGLDLNAILSTAILDMYGKCGSLQQANIIFRKMKDRNVITWTAMLVGFAQNGYAEDAINLFMEMQEEGVAANSYTLVSLVHSCALLGSLKKGKSVHSYLIRTGFGLDAINTTALIDMYSKCGKLKSAEHVFNNCSIYGDTILWNSMIRGYGTHGHGHKAVDLYRKMIKDGLQPNETTFVCLLTACSHSGLVDEGINLFNSMENEYSVTPTEEHYACFIDMLSRAGRLEEAEASIEMMPFNPGSDVFEALLNGCRIHKNINMGVRTAEKLLSLDGTNPGNYVMISNLFAEVGRWDAVDNIRGRMRKSGLKKTPGYSSIEVSNQVHTFFSGDDSLPKWKELSEYLEHLKYEVEACGYVPNIGCVLHDVDEQTKVKLLWGHSERLAIAFGLLSTPAESLIMITKNLRVCVDCHAVTKYISKLHKREIIVRDANRFHHFSDGKCSCDDYW